MQSFHRCLLVHGAYHMTYPTMHLMLLHPLQDSMIERSSWVPPPLTQDVRPGNPLASDIIGNLFQLVHLGETSGGNHWNSGTYGFHAGGAHPTGMHSCWSYFFSIKTTFNFSIEWFLSQGRKNTHFTVLIISHSGKYYVDRIYLN